MKLVRFKKDDLDVRYGVLNGQELSVLDERFSIGVDKDSYHSFCEDQILLDSVVLIQPCQPTKIIGIAQNFKGVSNADASIKEPLAFSKTPNSLAMSGEQIHLNENSSSWGECELAVVIGRQVSNIIEENVNEHILGYVPANDVTSDNLYNRDHHLARSKCSDGYCPVGKAIDLDYCPENKKIRGYQNGELIREGNTDDMIFSVNKIISWLSKWMTLLPGDIVLTGAPPRVVDKRYLGSGDIYTVEIEGLERVVSEFR